MRPVWCRDSSPEVRDAIREANLVLSGGRPERTDPFAVALATLSVVAFLVYAVMA